MRTNRIPLDDGPWLEDNPPPPTDADAPGLSDEEHEALWWHWRQQLDDLDRDRWDEREWDL